MKLKKERDDGDLKSRDWEINEKSKVSSIDEHMDACGVLCIFKHTHCVDSRYYQHFVFI